MAIVRQLLFIFIIFMGPKVIAAGICKDILRQNPPLDEVRLSQELVWSQRESNNEIAADALENKIVQSMTSDPIVKVEFLTKGTTDKFLIALASGIKAVWKPVSSGAKNEIAASVFDRLHKLDSVPITVPRKYQGKNGSLQYFIKNIEDTDGKDLTGHRFSPEMFFFDLVSAYEDYGEEYETEYNGRQIIMRKPENFAVRSPFREILFDNAETFGFYYTDTERNESMRQMMLSFVTETPKEFGISLNSMRPDKKTLQRWNSVSDRTLFDALLPFIGKKRAQLTVKRRRYYLNKIGVRRG